jgi:hypothetical protein
VCFLHINRLSASLPHHFRIIFASLSHHFPVLRSPLSGPDSTFRLSTPYFFPTVFPELSYNGIFPSTLSGYPSVVDLETAIRFVPTRTVSILYYRRTQLASSVLLTVIQVSPSDQETSTIQATDNGPFGQQFGISIVSGYSCPGNMLVYGTLYGDNTSEQNGPETLAIVTGSQELMFEYSKLPTAPISPATLIMVIVICSDQF